MQTHTMSADFYNIFEVFFANPATSLQFLTSLGTRAGLDDFEDDFRRIYSAIEDIEQQVTVKNRLFNMKSPV